MNIDVREKTQPAAAANDIAVGPAAADADFINDDDDFEPPSPSAYPLCSNEGRCGFLEAYIWRGEAALWESVNHIWNQLLPPKAERCTAIGLAAGTGGTGKAALIPFLRRALRESLDDGLVQPGPEFTDIHEFHAASMDYFAASYAHYEKTIQKCADLINGGSEAIPNAEVIEGPWKHR